MGYLPTNNIEMQERGWDEVDFIFISGDAYVDHPSFGSAIITRTLNTFGYKVAFLAQPNWHSDDEFCQFGKPKYGFLISSGNIDSMVNHYTTNKKRRSKDNYSDNGEMGKRPDRADIVYTQIIRRLFPDSAIILGGIEASLRRLAHYDYWDDKVRNSIIIDSQADMVIYGMAEKTIIEVADALASGLAIRDITYVKGTAYKTKTIDYLSDYITLPSRAEIDSDKMTYCKSFKLQYENRDALNAKTLCEAYDGWYIIQNTPALPLSRQEMDDTYDLDYEYRPHPKYQHIPAFDEIQFSIVSNRGCFGSCSFCALTAHQGRIISSRSEDSIVKEAIRMTEDKDFKGYIHDVGGPTANFYQPSCEKQLTLGTCKNKECLYPKPCVNLNIDHHDYLSILRKLRNLPNIKKVFIRSGIRYDYLVLDKDESFFDELVKYHISGQLKVAPEHISPQVLQYMHKPSKELYDKFVSKYQDKNKKFNMNQFLVPYLISSHPGSDLNTSIELALYLKKNHYIPEQVQDFYPTPATASTCMYYTGIDPFTMKSVYVAKDLHEKKLQRALLQFNNPFNYDLVKTALIQADREDLIGNGENCLIPLRKAYNKKTNHVR